MSGQTNYIHTGKLNNAKERFQPWCSIICTDKLSAAELWPRPASALPNRSWAWFRSYDGPRTISAALFGYDHLVQKIREFTNTSATYSMPVCSNTKQQSHVHIICLYKHDNLICIMPKKAQDKKTEQQ